MKDYASMSDFEINKSVADIAMNGAWHVKPSHPDNDTGGWLYGSNGKQTHELPDYCNSPADAWPIIDDNNIALIPSGVVGWVAVSDLTLNGKSPYIDERLGDCFQHEDYSGLRAAMIVFLMMKDGE